MYMNILKELFLYTGKTQLSIITYIIFLILTVNCFT